LQVQYARLPYLRPLLFEHGREVYSTNKCVEEFSANFACMRLSEVLEVTSLLRRGVRDQGVFTL